jgi:nuclear protein localization family protein 4
VQEGGADSLHLDRNTEEEGRVKYIAEIFGWKPVGWIFAQSNKEREHILSVEEVCQIAAIQDELGQEAVTGVVSMSSEGDVHFEAFQVTSHLACCSFGTLFSARVF